MKCFLENEKKEKYEARNKGMERGEHILFKCLKKRIHDEDETECQKDLKKGMEREEREHIVLMFLKK